MHKRETKDDKINKKILFLQFRYSDMVPKEQEIVLALADKPSSDFECRSFFQEDISKLDVRDYSHIILGGGSNSNISEKILPWFKDVKRIVLEAEKYSVPVIGLCQGMQFIAWSFGARIIADKSMAGVGTEEIIMQNTKGSFYEFLPDKFENNMIHNDSVTDLPDCLVNYGRTEKCPVAVIGHKEKPIYGLQFHHELTKPYVKYALEVAYGGKYIKPEENQKMIDSIIEPRGVVAEIIPRFLSLN